ncbi:MAG: hypothetical protein NC184_02670 [Roseburia sp.]|nr:hypothetical protein [Roseburia sp.]
MKHKIQKKSVYFKQYALQDILKCTPYTSAYTNAPSCGLDEYNFMQQLYVAPVFEERLEILNRELDELIGNKQESNKDAIAEIEMEIQELNNLNALKNKFENDLYTNNDPKIRYICGYSGSGKSTYLGHLFLNCRQNKNITHVFDLSSTDTSSTDILGIRFENLISQETLSKLLFKIVNDTIDIFKKKADEDVPTHRKKLNKYVTFYNKNIKNNNEDYEAFYSCIEEYVNKESEQIDYADLYKSFRYSIRNLIVERLNVVNQNITKNALSTLIRYFFSFFIMLKWAEIPQGKKCFIALDSIEHYIGPDAVYDRDIILVCNIFTNELTQLKEQYESWMGRDVFWKNFSFIIALRDTTAKILPTANDEDNDREEINISDWFIPAQIAKKRIEFFAKKGVESANSSIAKAIVIALDDDAKYHGKLNRISEMHNQNKRRMNEYLCDVILEQDAEQYIQLYNEAEKIRQGALNSGKGDNSDSKMSHYLADVHRRASRDLIVHLLFNGIDNKGYFDDIYVKGKHPNVGKSYARKILTYISAKKDKEYSPETENYITIVNLIKGAFQKGNELIDEAELNNIIHVLYNLNKPSKKKTHWCQNVVIKFNSEQFNESKLYDVISYLYYHNEDDENYSVKITAAGRFYLNRMSDYEYFICRYIEKSKSLFDGMYLEKDGEEFKCLKVIEIIKQQAMSCINEIITQDELFFSPNLNYAFMYSNGEAEKRGYLYVKNDGVEVTHVERLIDSHISYLDYYRNYILYKYKNEGIISKQDCILLSSKILDVMQEYVDKLQDVVDTKKSNNPELVYYIGSKRRLRDREQYYKGFASNIEKARVNVLEYCIIKKYN